MIDADFALNLGKFRLKANFHDRGITLLTGENGSGKSTFLNALAGFVPIHSGAIAINGRYITGLEIQKRGIVHINPGSYLGNMPVDRHIAFPGTIHEAGKGINELKESFGIDFTGKVGNLSMGQRIRVSLATAFYRKPEAVLIDEALSNLSDPLEVLEEIRIISAETNTDVLIVAHNITNMKVDHSYSMENGSMFRLY